MRLAKLLLLFCVCVWGWTFVATKISLQYLTPISIVALRFSIGLPILFLILRLRHIPLQFGKSEYRALAAGAGIIGVHFIIQAIALNYTTATNTGWIITVTPLAMAVLGYVLLKERIGRNALLGILAATLGVLLLISDGDFTTLGWMQSVGDWIILASAHTWALYTIVTRDVSRARNPLAVTFFVLLPLTVVADGYTLFSGSYNTLAEMPLEGWVAILFLGILGTVTQWFWQISVAKIGASRAGVFLFLEPIATMALAVPLLGEALTVFVFLGGAMVTFGVWAAQRTEET